MNLRRTCIALASHTNTPIPFFLELPLTELANYVEIVQEMIEEGGKK